MPIIPFPVSSAVDDFMRSANKPGMAAALVESVDYTNPPSATALLNQNLFDQVWPDDLTYEFIPNVTYATDGTAGTGGVLANVGGQVWLKTGTDAGSRRSRAYQITHQLAFPGTDVFGAASFQKPMWASFRFNFQAALSTNAIFRCSVGHSGDTGALSVRGFGFLVSYNAAGVGDVKIFAHDGTTLTTSSVLATIATNDSKAHTLTLASDGLGNLYAFLDGTYIGTITGGPTTVGSGGNITQEILNGADAIDNGVMLTSIRTRVKKN